MNATVIPLFSKVFYICLSINFIMEFKKVLKPSIVQIFIPIIAVIIFWLVVKIFTCYPGDCLASYLRENVFAYIAVFVIFYLLVGILKKK